MDAGDGSTNSGGRSLRFENDADVPIKRCPRSEPNAL